MNVEVYPVVSGAIGVDPTVSSALAGEVAKGATNALVKAFVERVVTPYFGDKKSKTKIIGGVRKYARNIEFRTRCIPTIAIQGGAFVLDEIYEPLDLVQIGGDQSFKVNGYPSTLFNESRCVAVVDAAGMGKSTLTKYIIRRCLCELRKIPILVELRRIRQGQSIVSFACDELLGAERSDQVTAELVSSLSEGNYVFLLDGFDEVDPDLRSQISEEISRISAEYQYCSFWLTSRPDPVLSSLAEFTSYEIANLTKDQAFSLLKRYDKGRGLAPLLIEKLQGLSQVDEFLGNPLLVTLLYKAFDYKATIPIKRNIFFRQVFDALYQDHDLSKEGSFERRKRSALDIDDFHRFLRSLGFGTFKAGKVQYSQVEFQVFIAEALKRAQLSADASKIRSDLLSAVPLFVKDGSDIRWSHKAFQDYFASQFIYYDSAGMRDDLVAKLFFSDSVGRYENILCLLGELDVGLLREVCILPFVRNLGLLSGAPEVSTDLGVAAAFLSQAIDVYVLQGLELKRKNEPAGHWLPTVVKELVSAYPSVEARDLGMTFSMRAGVVVVGLQQPQILRFSVACRIDGATFAAHKSRVQSLEGIGAVTSERVTWISDQLRRGVEPAVARLFVDLAAQTADLGLPTCASLLQLECEVVARQQAKVTASILEGF